MLASCISTSKVPDTGPMPVASSALPTAVTVTVHPSTWSWVASHAGQMLVPGAATPDSVAFDDLNEPDLPRRTASVTS